MVYYLYFTKIWLLPGSESIGISTAWDSYDSVESRWSRRKDENFRIIVYSKPQISYLETGLYQINLIASSVLAVMMPGLTRQHFYFVLLATSNTVINGQFSTESKGDNCIGGECIIISSCKPILRLVFQVRILSNKNYKTKSPIYRSKLEMMLLRKS